jgi:hypothetical protein
MCIMEYTLLMQAHFFIHRFQVQSFKMCRMQRLFRQLDYQQMCFRSPDFQVKLPFSVQPFWN